MKLSKELIEMGIDESLIRIIHSKTKLKNSHIKSAELVRSSDNKLLARLTLLNPNTNKTREVVINIDKSRIRELKLKMIFN